jgi:uncharacterized protein (TIGR02145 family)
MIPRKQIGFSQEESLLWEISKQIDKTISTLRTTGTVITTTTIAPTTTTTTTGTSTTTTTTTVCLNCTEQDVTIGTQIWQKCNLNVETYSDGETIIPEVQDQTAWVGLTTGAWCYYNNDPANGAIYGKLYNWYAVAGIYDPASLANPALRKKLGPDGYHVPTLTEFQTLLNVADPASEGGTIIPNIGGNALKEIGNCHWDLPNDSINNTGFTAFGAGYRLTTTDPIDNPFSGLKDSIAFYTSTEADLTSAYISLLYADNAIINPTNPDKRFGFSVRLIKD